MQLRHWLSPAPVSPPEANGPAHSRGAGSEECRAHRWQRRGRGCAGAPGTGTGGLGDGLGSWDRWRRPGREKGAPGTGIGSWEGRGHRWRDGGGAPRTGTGGRGRGYQGHSEAGGASREALGQRRGAGRRAGDTRDRHRGLGGARAPVEGRWAPGQTQGQGLGRRDR